MHSRNALSFHVSVCRDCRRGRFVYLESLCVSFSVATACWDSTAVLGQTVKLKVSFDLLLLHCFFVVVVVFFHFRKPF